MAPLQTSVPTIGCQAAAPPGGQSATVNAVGLSAFTGFSLFCAPAQLFDLTVDERLYAV